MLSACKKPFPTHRCGQCQYCRVIDRLDKVNRLKLEFGMRPHAVFITLTYDDEYLPVFNYSKKAELYKPDLIKFIDKIRNKLPKITIFAVGEYGGQLFGAKDAKRPIHPHYHLAVFSDDPTFLTKIRTVTEKSWTMGHAHILLLSSGLIDYITGYVSKKLTNTKSMEKIMSLSIRPEFSYSSRRPAIGDISQELVPIIEQYGDITHLTIDSKLVNIPKYLKHKTKDLFLKWDLNLKDPNDLKIYNQRKEKKKYETMQTMYEKNEEEKAQIAARNIKRSDLKKQITANFESKIRLKQFSKGKLL